MEPRTHETTVERRRFGRIVHDERGNGSVQWYEVEAKKGFQRDTLSIEGAPLAIEQKVDTFNPYERAPGDQRPDKKPVKRDLRKLSEWIKTMRAVEENKKSSDE
jgi:hypothetical protein